MFKEVIKMTRKWLGSSPTQCDVCRGGIHSRFIDGKVDRGGWAILCPLCHAKFGNGLGVGRGQAYEKVGEEWIKIV